MRTKGNDLIKQKNQVKEFNALPLPQKLEKLSLVLSIVVALLGLTVLIGWSGDIDLLKRGLPGLPGMKANTAVCFLLAGMALILLNKKSQRRVDVIVAGIFSFATFLLASATFLQYIFQFNLGIDEFLFRDDTFTKEFLYPGRPAPQTALCFILVGTSLLLITIKKSNALIFQWISIISGLFAFFSIIGYLFGAKQLVGISNYTTIALNTSLGLLCLTLASLFLLPQAGLMKLIGSNMTGGRLFRNVFPLVIVIMVLIGWLRLQGQLAGWYDTRLGLALYNITFIIVFGVTLFYYSITLNKAEKEQKDTDKDLQKSLQEASDYKYALEQSSIVSITDESGIIKHVNDNFCEISKYSRTELMGQDHRIINSGFHTKEFIRSIWVTIASGQIWRGEIKNKAKDGTIYWVQSTIVPLLNSEGMPNQYIAIRTDITERKNAEEAIQKLNEELEEKAIKRANELLEAKDVLAKNSELIRFLATVADNIQDPVIYSDMKFSVTKWNKAAEDLLEWKSEEVIGKNTVDVLKPIYPGTTREQLIASLIKNNSWKGEGIFYSKSGNPVNVLITSSFYKDSIGNSTGYFSVIRDITERKKSEIEMSRMNKRLLLATASAAMGVWDWDIANNILTWDDGMFNLYGIDKSDFGSVYEAWISKLHPEDKMEIDQEIQLAIEGKKEYNTEFRIIAGDLSVHYIRATAIFEYDDAGKAIRMIGVNWDVTKSKEAEAQIKLLNEDLENKILNRTRQLETSNKELESFSYSVAHDLRTPLRAVNSYAQILKEDYGQAIDEEGKQVLEKIHYNATKMGALIDELLAFSRLGRKEIHKTAIDTNTMLQSIVNDFTHTHKFHAAIHIAPMPAALADAALLHQVFVNLLSNAIKYSAKKEHPVVEIFAEQQDGKTVFAVKDNGAGFDMRFADKLFGVFHRLHSEKEFEGNGVGLAIVHRIISKHGGRVWAEGKENNGATFYFTLN